MTDAGTLATVDALLDRVTVSPPLGAGPLSETVPVDEAPPVTADGLIASETNASGLIVRVAVLDVPP